jgi:hypothetical protein
MPVGIQVERPLAVWPESIKAPALCFYGQHLSLGFNPLEKNDNGLRSGKASLVNAE